MEIYSIFAFFYLTSCIAEKTTYHRLIEDLFRNYSSVVRPVRNYSNPTKIFLEFKIIKLLELDTRNEFIRLMGWLTEIWYDELLCWDPALYEDISQVSVDNKQIWKPDTYIAVMLNLNLATSVRPQPVRVHTLFPAKRAAVWLSYPVLFKLSCKIEVRDFPSDIQSCKIGIFSWARDETEITYSSKIPYTGYFHQNLQWRMTNVTKEDSTIAYEVLQSSGETLLFRWSEVHWTFEFQRRSGFFIITLIVPTVIVVQACLWGIFTLSQSDGIRFEKVTLGITTILALSVLMLVVGDMVPRASKPTPKINTFFIIQIVLISSSLFVSELIVYFHYYGLSSGRPVSKWLQFLGCATRKKGKKKSIMKDSHSRPEIYAVERPYSADRTLYEEFKKIEARIKNLIRKVKTATSKRKSEAEDRAKEWHEAMIKLELVCFLLFSLCSFIDTLVFFYNQPDVKSEYNPK